MDPVKEEHYKKLIRNAMMESYGPPVASPVSTPCGSLNEERLVNRMISLMKANELENQGLVLVKDWGNFYKNGAFAHTSTYSASHDPKPSNKRN